MKKLLIFFLVLTVISFGLIVYWRERSLAKEYPVLSFSEREIEFSDADLNLFPAQFLEFESPAQNIFIADIKSDYPIFKKNENKVVSIASLTKIFTSLAMLEYYDLEKTIQIPWEATWVVGSKMHLLAGDVLKVEDLVIGMLVASANDAAKALEVEYGSELIEKMNQIAKNLKLKNTKLVETIGLSSDNVSTAKELYVISKYAFNNPFFRRAVRIKEVDIVSQKGLVYQVKSTNRLVKEDGSYWGIKTGYIEEAKNCLISGYNFNNQKIISVVLGSENWGERFLVTDLIKKAIERQVVW